jgi:hypothetical protein
MPADDLSDLSSRYALIRHAVIAGSRGTLLKHEPIKMSSIDPMYGRPAVEPVADIRRNSFFARNVDETRHEAVIAFAMD